MHIREASVADAEEIAQVQLQAWKSAYSGIMPEEFIDSMDVEIYRSNWQRALKHSGPGRYLVAVNDDVLLGFSVFGPARDADLDGERSAELVGINVKPTAWRSGVGTALLRDVVKETSASYQTLYLWVAKQNVRAIQFYESHGFSLEGKEKTEESHGNVAEVRYVLPM
ncbi:GNAT family N-acetyltransferase [Gilvimarinus agarilyticus]|uniref:GNAT family N-acetyltransferase n=1 Tax=Gilvimarinus agarilyticus TaxID=679259 RepID=UPI0005A19CA2|nr:GNAT family N-acetyltransferase [Gilvimarinus agarilyticus]